MARNYSLSSLEDFSAKKVVINFTDKALFKKITQKIFNYTGLVISEGLFGTYGSELCIDLSTTEKETKECIEIDWHYKSGNLKTYSSKGYTIVKDTDIKL